MFPLMSNNIGMGMGIGFGIMGGQEMLQRAAGSFQGFEMSSFSGPQGSGQSSKAYGGTFGRDGAMFSQEAMFSAGRSNFMHPLMGGMGQCPHCGTQNGMGMVPGMHPMMQNKKGKKMQKQMMKMMMMMLMKMMQMTMMGGNQGNQAPQANRPPQGGFGMTLGMTMGPNGIGMTAGMGFSQGLEGIGGFGSALGMLGRGMA